MPDPTDLSLEFVVDHKTGLVRQAGATQAEGQFVLDFKGQAERSLYLFTKVVLKRKYLVPRLHAPLCHEATRRDEDIYRKLILIPRNHAKTSCVSHGLPVHALIQPAESNLYLPGRDGADTRILLGCEKASMAQERLRVIMTAFESNQLLRAFWPHRCWENPRSESKAWNATEIIIPRPTPFGDPSIRTIGVDGAVTGARVDLAIRDDLISREAANSAIVMQHAIDWHYDCRALYDREDTPELTIGTRWAPSDLYEVIQHAEQDTVRVYLRAAIEDGVPIWPERFSLDPEAGKISLHQLRDEMKEMFYLQYMNAATDPALVDFDVEGDLRYYEVRDGKLVFTESPRAAAVNLSAGRPAMEAGPPPPGAAPLAGDEDVDLQGAFMEGRYRQQPQGRRWWEGLR